jgi:glycerate dehydrogenase
MKIVIIDGYTLNPGDLTWEGVKHFGEVTLYERTPLALIPERCREAEILLTNKIPISADTINNCPFLKLICVTATGYNIIDIEAAKKKNILVCNVPDYGTASVAQHTFALLFELTNLVGVNSISVRNGEWQSCEDFCYSKGKLTELKGKTLGIVGLGKIGLQVATIAKAFEMNVIYYNRTKKEQTLATYADLEELFSCSDVVSIHCPLTKENTQFINRRLLGYLKPTAWIINTSRGQLINESDLAEALNSDQLAGAALDVLSMEPPPDSNPLLTAKNCIITPHTAWMSREARERILSITEKNIQAFFHGTPVNVVSG